MGNETKSLLGNNSNSNNKNVHKVEKEPIGKSVAFISIGFLTLIYVLVELGAALYLGSLALLSDGFHNLSDVVSLYIAWWAQKAAKRDSDNFMSYGWARAEILGGLTNGCFLLSMSLYVALEAIPRFVEPKPMESGLIFMVVAGAGLAINILGTIVFACTGMAHAHSHGGGGGHSHGGDKKEKSGDHGHAHGGDKKKEKSGDHGHAHGSTEKKEKKEKVGHGHSHDGVQKKEEHDHHDHSDENHGHSHGSSAIGINHDGDEHHDHEEEKGEGHGHSHGEKKEKKEKGHGHSHGEKKEKKEKGHGHSHGDGEKKKKKKKGTSGTCLGMDLNMFGVFIHFLGDAVSSLFVLITGAVIHFTHGKWTDYIDPAVSLLIVALIAATSIPLVKRCSLILLQKVPDDIDLETIRSKMLKVQGVLTQHDLHVWQLVDGMTIASVHIGIEQGSDFQVIASKLKKIFHKEGIHSTSIQPEFISINNNNNNNGASSDDSNFCIQNCVDDCEEEWCCKKSADRIKMRNLAYSTVVDINDI